MAGEAETWKNGMSRSFLASLKRRKTLLARIPPRIPTFLENSNTLQKLIQQAVIQCSTIIFKKGSLIIHKSSQNSFIFVRSKRSSIELCLEMPFWKKICSFRVRIRCLFVCWDNNNIYHIDMGQSFVSTPSEPWMESSDLVSTVRVMLVVLRVCVTKGSYNNNLLFTSLERVLCGNYYIRFPSPIYSSVSSTPHS